MNRFVMLVGSTLFLIATGASLEVPRRALGQAPETSAPEALQADAEASSLSARETSPPTRGTTDLQTDGVADSETSDAPSQIDDGSVKAATPPPIKDPSQPERQTLEVTFGSAQLFNHQSIVTNSGRVEKQVIPVTSALLMLEWLWHDRWSAITLFNLPLTTQKTVVDGQPREEFVAPSISLGLRAAALRFDVFAASRLELQLAALAGLTIGSSSGDLVFPLAAGRLHFSNHAGFALYLGGAYAFRRETIAILYGFGHRF